MRQHCCEEMAELVSHLVDSKGVPIKRESYAFYVEEDGEPDELQIIDSSFIPNLIFRFCPYCGKALVSAEPPKSKEDFIADLQDIINGALLNDTSVSVMQRTALLEDAVQRAHDLVYKVYQDGKFWGSAEKSC